MASRTELFARLGMNKPIVEPLLEAIYKVEEEQIWREDLQSNPHGQHWHESFHASSFPGDDPKACGRKAIYTLMNIPAMAPTDRAGRAVMDAGKDIERQVVKRFERSGLLLTPGPDADYQMGFEDEKHWLTGSPDLIINTPRLNRPHPIEIKTKDHDAIQKMQAGMKSYDPAHRIQVLTYIGLTKEKSKELWPELDECKDGTIYYLSRNRPDVSHEFKFEYNAEFMKKGRVKLASWKEHFLNETLPERPKSWRWTEPPCKWCPLKKVCKEDYKDGVRKLSDSNTINHAKEVRGEYDYKLTRQDVILRWEEGVI